MWAPFGTYAMGAGRGLLSVCQRPSTAQGGDARAFKRLGRDHGWVVECIRGPPQGMHPMRDACFAGCAWWWHKGLKGFARFTLHLRFALKACAAIVCLTLSCAQSAQPLAEALPTGGSRHLRKIALCSLEFKFCHGWRKQKSPSVSAEALEILGERRHLWRSAPATG